MEPISIASAFVSIVSLLGVYKSERRAEDSATIDQYIEWLRRREHEQLANLIQQCDGLSHSLQALLSQQHDDVIAKLRRLDQVLSDVASHVVGFKEIANAMRVSSRLSDQSISILRQMNEAKASRLADLKGFEDMALRAVDGDGRGIDISEARFIEDDLVILCELGLLRQDFGSRGTRIFWITRAGSEVGG